jgi:hypothetical protein
MTVALGASLAREFLTVKRSEVQVFDGKDAPSRSISTSTSSDPVRSTLVSSSDERRDAWPISTG